MMYLARGLLLLLMIIPLASCKKPLKAEEMPSHVVLGDDYYTQFVIRYEKGAHPTTNYRRGASVPVNTPARLIAMTNKTIQVELDNSSQKLLVQHIAKHTGDDIYQAFDKLFAKQKVDLSQFNPLEKQHIESGTVAPGMRKNAVIVAIGYPPITETPNLKSNAWVYWSGRFNRFRVHFKDDIVSRIED